MSLKSLVISTIILGAIFSVYIMYFASLLVPAENCVLAPPGLTETIGYFSMREYWDVQEYWDARETLNELYMMIHYDTENAFVLLRAEMQYKLDACSSSDLKMWLGQLTTMGMKEIKANIKYADAMLMFNVPPEVNEIRVRAERIYEVKENVLIMQKMRRIRERLFALCNGKYNYAKYQRVIRDMNVIIRSMTTDQWNAFNTNTVFQDISNIQGRLTRGNNVNPMRTRLHNQFKKACINLLERSQ